MDFLGDTLEKIAFEKAGILKPGVPCATGAQDRRRSASSPPQAAAVGAPLLARGRTGASRSATAGCAMPMRRGRWTCRRRRCSGAHQADNAGIAIAALRAWNPAWLDARRSPRASPRAEWPGRLQRLQGAGGRAAGGLGALARWRAQCRRRPGARGAARRCWADRPLHLIVGMKGSKAVADFLRPLLPHAATPLGGGGAGPAPGDAGRAHRRGQRRRGAPRPDGRRGAGRAAARRRRRPGCWSAAASIWPARC